MSQKLLQTCFTPFYFSIHTKHEIIHVTLFYTMDNNSNSRTEILLILADQSRYDSANIGRWRFHNVGKVSGTSSTNNIHNVTTYLWRFFLGTVFT